MSERRKPCGYWGRARCTQQELKHSSRVGFRRGGNDAHALVVNHE